MSLEGLDENAADYHSFESIRVRNIPVDMRSLCFRQALLALLSLLSSHIQLKPFAHAISRHQLQVTASLCILR
jgi:hypothetical protein